MKILILDDELGRVESLKKHVGSEVEVIHVLDRQHFCQAITSDKYDIIMLDHDLGAIQDSLEWDGRAAAKILTGARSYLGDGQVVIIHSLNPIGAANMASIMAQPDHLDVFVIPGAWLKMNVGEDKRIRIDV